MLGIAKARSLSRANSRCSAPECYRAPMPDANRRDPTFPLNCPWCGEPLRYACTAEDAAAQSWSVPVYECRTHGSLYLTQDGLKREPPSPSQ